VEGTALIARERMRQVAQEGWTAEHDDGHSVGEMAVAAACYALPKDIRERVVWQTTLLEYLWPWEFYWWKPAEKKLNRAKRIRELVKAGALIAAEIDRLQREIDAQKMRKTPNPGAPNA
jgi:hypothetical protein